MRSAKEKHSKISTIGWERHKIPHLSKMLIQCELSFPVRKVCVGIQCAVYRIHLENFVISVFSKVAKEIKVLLEREKCVFCEIYEVAELI